MKSSGRSPVRILLIILALGVLLPGGWYFFTRLEGTPPEVVLEPDLAALGRSQELSVSVTDSGRGLRFIRILLTAGGQERTLFEENYDGSTLLGTGSRKDADVRISIEPQKLGLPDGEGILRVVAADYSWRRWFNGNLAELERKIAIDTLPPRVAVLTTSHYINQGGAGLVAFKVSEECPRLGVTVGDHFYPAHSGFFANSDVYISLFAVAYDQKTSTTIAVTAMDGAGNLTTAGFPYRIRKKRFRTDILDISDRFIETRLRGIFTAQGGQENSNKDLFLHVNQTIRKANYTILTALGSRTEKIRFWDGPFLRLPNSAPRAGFADHRIYKYKGREVDRQVHLGADLASIRQSPVPAANRGKVVFSDNVGIYGNTIVIDHGFGLMTTYSHLSEISVNPGDEVQKGDTIGRTGATGLAGGDHLHFGVMVHDTFVNPVEWWDPGWVRDNIDLKIEQVTARLNS